MHSCATTHIVGVVPEILSARIGNAPVPSRPWRQQYCTIDDVICTSTALANVVIASCESASTRHK